MGSRAAAVSEVLAYRGPFYIRADTLAIEILIFPDTWSGGDSLRVGSPLLLMYAHLLYFTVDSPRRG